MDLVWKGKKLHSMGDVMKVIVSIAESGNRKRAVEFTQAYVESIGKPDAAVQAAIQNAVE